MLGLMDIEKLISPGHLNCTIKLWTQGGMTLSWGTFQVTWGTDKIPLALLPELCEYLQYAVLVNVLLALCC